MASDEKNGKLPWGVVGVGLFSIVESGCSGCAASAGPVVFEDPNEARASRELFDLAQAMDPTHADVCSGCLLGYPGEAVSQTCFDEALACGGDASAGCDGAIGEFEQCASKARDAGPLTAACARSCAPPISFPSMSIFTCAIDLCADKCDLADAGPCP